MRGQETCAKETWPYPPRDKIDQAEGFFWALVEFQGNIKHSPGKTKESRRQQEQKLVN